jgi:hypothetical protein
MDWRREDTGYAAAALGALLVVGYLLAANFGLVPSPLPSGLVQAQADVSALAASEPPADIVVRPPAAPPPVAPPVEASQPPASVLDRTPPAVAFGTPDGATFGVTESAAVSGSASDELAGVAKVDVTFKPEGGTPSTVPATLRCTNATHRSCSWSAKIPGVAGTYVVEATAYDRSGNIGKAKPINVQTVNPGGVVGQVGGAVGRAPSVLEKAVSGLLSGLL